MKTIYMGITIAMIHEGTPQIAQQILEQGEVKETEEGVKYILINEEQL